MKNLVPKLKKAFPFISERIVNEKDLFDFCAKKNCQIVFDREISTGVYVRFMGSDYIFLNPKLSGFWFLYVFAHEVGHLMFHAPSRSSVGVEFFDLHSRRKNHSEAETVAALLVLPIPELENALISGAYKDDSRLADLIARRLDIFNLHGM